MNHDFRLGGEAAESQRSGPVLVDFGPYCGHLGMLQLIEMMAFKCQ